MVCSIRNNKYDKCRLWIYEGGLDIINNSPNPTAQQIIDEAADTLRQNDATDIHLLNILVKHVVTLPSNKTTVDLAMADIENLAIERSND